MFIFIFFCYWNENETQKKYVFAVECVSKEKGAEKGGNKPKKTFFIHY